MLSPTQKQKKTTVYDGFPTKKKEKNDPVMTIDA
jgi:hypothetical protein